MGGGDMIDTIAYLAACIRQAWAEDYPPELAPANVEGRKEWRRNRLIDLLIERLELDESFRAEAGGTHAV